ncbi:MAG: NYN domain-containing protein [Candidatus Acidiferrales bacterium]
MAIANVYIDGFNLYYGAVKNSPFKWLDLGALCRRMLPGDTIQSIEYFTAIVSARPYDPGMPMRQQMYIRALRTIPNLTISFGHFLTHSARMVLTGTIPPKKVWVDKTEEKGSDVNIAAHLLHDAFRGRFEVAVLVTNDSDLLEPVRIVRQEFNLPVGILNPHQHHSAALKTQATFMKRIRQSDVAACQFPAVMKHAKGTFHKPTAW